MQTVVDLRRNRRYQLSLPVKVQSANSRAGTVDASSRDISAKGIYFTISKSFALNSKLEFDVDLPRALAQGKEVRIRCSAKIVRVDELKNEKRVGVAARIESYKFVRKS